MVKAGGLTLVRPRPSADVHSGEAVMMKLECCILSPRKNAGCCNKSWFPLGCSRSLHVVPVTMGLRWGCCRDSSSHLIPPVGHPFRVVRITPRTGPGEMLLNEVGGEAQKNCAGGGGVILHGQ